MHLYDSCNVKTTAALLVACQTAQFHTGFGVLLVTRQVPCRSAKHIGLTFFSPNKAVNHV